MYQFLYKYGISVAFGVAFFASVISIAVLNVKSLTYGEARAEAIELNEVKSEENIDAKNQLLRNNTNKILLESQRKGVGVLIGWADIFIIIAALLAIGFPIYKSIGNPKSLLKIGVGIISLLILYGIAYASASSKVVNATVDYSAGAAKFSGAIVGLTVIGIILALAAIVGGEIYRLVKER